MSRLPVLVNMYRTSDPDASYTGRSLSMLIVYASNYHS
jgi:hypothetical protein